MNDASQKILSEAIGALSAGVPPENAVAIREIVETVYRAGVREGSHKWQMMYRRAFHCAAALTNYIADRPELRRIEKDLAVLESEERELP